MPNKAAPLVLAVLAAGLIAMFAAVVYQRVQGPGLVVAARHNHPVSGAPEGQAQNTASSGAPGASSPWQAPAGLSNEDADELGRLMALLQASPRDLPALLAIADIFSRNREWTQAGAFLQRARAAAPGDVRPLHLLGLNHTAMGDYASAEAAFEDALALGSNPAVSYSLAILYTRYMKTPGKAIPLLEALLREDAAPPAIRERATEELAGIR